MSSMQATSLVQSESELTMSDMKTVEAFFAQNPSPSAQTNNLRAERDEMRALTKPSTAQKKQLASIEEQLFELRKQYRAMRALRADLSESTSEHLNDKDVVVLSQLRDNIDAFLATQNRQRKAAKRVTRAANVESLHEQQSNHVLVQLAKMLSA